MKGCRIALLCLILIPLSMGYLSGQPAVGKSLMEYKGTETAAKDTSFYQFDFKLSEDGNLLLLNFDSELKEGKLNIWFGGGGYDVIANYDQQGYFTMEDEVYGPLNNTEPITVKITTEKAIGDWEINFSEISRNQNIIYMFLSGILTVVVTLVFILGWKKISQSKFKWLFIGACVWIVGVALKFGFAYLLNDPILEFLKTTTGQIGYLSIGSFYIGILTGIFEIGITLVFALFIKKMYENHRNGVSVGVGAGTFEALLIGLAPIGNAIMVLSGNPQSTGVLVEVSKLSMITPLFWLIGATERIIAILCHISSRTLVLYAVAKKKYLYFWAGFFLLTAIDIIAGYFHLADLVGKISIWWIELAILPFAIISIPIIRWCIKNWKPTDKELIDPAD